jgi:AsmA-like C-terminal region/AsmA family
MKFANKRVLLMLAALVALLGVFVQSFNTMAGKHRDQVQQELHKVLGKDVSYERLTASFWSGLGFSARGFRIADNPRFAATPLVYASELILGVSWWNLLLGRLVIDSMTFKEPEFQIITDEQGALNLAELGSRKEAIGEFPKLPAPTPERQRPAVSFTINSFHVKNGRIDYIDRSVKEPAELQIKNVEMTVGGFHPGRPSRFSLTAALSQALERDVRIEGTIGPIINGRPWARQPVDLRLQFDSFYVPLLGRAVAFLRNKIPRELDVTGPMALHARLSGTLGNPRIYDLTLNVPLFGSSDYNAVLTAAIDLSNSGSWPDAQLHGKLRLEGIDVRQLRKVDFFKNNLPAGFAGEGLISVYSRFEGSWQNLRLGALIRADESELHITDWLRKPAGTKARLEAKVSRQKDALVLHESRLTLGDSDMKVAGRIDDLRQPRVQARLYSPQSRVAGWGNHFSPLDFHGSGGNAAWDLTASKNAALPEAPWILNGGLTITGASFRHQSSGRSIEDLSAEIVFLGRQVRIDRASFRVGSSQVAFAGYAPEVGSLPLNYRLRSAELNLLDLSQQLALPPTHLRDVTIKGSVESHDGTTIMSGSVASPEGTLREIPYRNLRADVSWSAAGLAFNNLALQAFNGTLSSSGSLAGAHHGFDITSQLQSADVRTLVAQIFPQLKQRVEGQLDFRGRFSAAANGNGAKRVQGSGEASISRGSIKDFNLLTHLFSRGSGGSPDAKSSASFPVALSELAKRPDTPFDSMKASLIVERQRLRTEHFVLSTPEYTVTGAGSIGFDRTAKWSGSLTLSPRLTQELQREYATLRYLVDRRGRLSFSFRVEGKLPNVKVKHENRALAQILRLTAAQPPKVGAAAEAKTERPDPAP